jgi:hypothetical protein
MMIRKALVEKALLRLAVYFVLLLVCGVIAAASQSPQEEGLVYEQRHSPGKEPASAPPPEEDEIRDIIRKKRAAASKPNQDTAVKQPPSRPRPTQSASANYDVKNRLARDKAIVASEGDSALGMTVWRLRPSSSDDAVEIKDLIQPLGGGPAQEWTPARVESETEIEEGQMVRLTIESFREGYLYVINRAKYADGSYGDAHLIFPTQRMYGGRNFVKPKQTIQIPGPKDEPDYLVLERGKSRQGELQVSEELIIIVKPEPFESFKTAPADRKMLTPQSVEALIARHKAPFEVGEMKGGAGKAITISEKKASKDDSVLLEEDDPYPQTVYRVAAKPTDPMLVIVQLKVRGK